MEPTVLTVYITACHATHQKVTASPTTWYRLAVEVLWCRKRYFEEELFDIRKK